MANIKHPKDWSVLPDRWFPHDNQFATTYHKTEWFIDDIQKIIKDLPLQEMPISHLNLSTLWFGKPDTDSDSISVWYFLVHMRHVMECDERIPVILNFDGQLLDGRHRIAKLIMQGKETFTYYKIPESAKPTKLL